MSTPERDRGERSEDRAESQVQEPTVAPLTMVGSEQGSVCSEGVCR